MSLLLYFYYKYHQRQVALVTADDMQRLIHRNLASWSVPTKRI